MTGDLTCQHANRPTYPPSQQAQVGKIEGQNKPRHPDCKTLPLSTTEPENFSLFFPSKCLSSLARGERPESHVRANPETPLEASWRRWTYWVPRCLIRVALETEYQHESKRSTHQNLEPGLKGRSWTLGRWEAGTKVLSVVLSWCVGKGWCGLEPWRTKPPHCTVFLSDSPKASETRWIKYSFLSYPEERIPLETTCDSFFF